MHPHDHPHGDHHHHDDLSEPYASVYELDHIDLTTVGIDVGTSTYHLAFSQVHLKREATSLSSRFVVVSRETIWKSSIYLTPYLNGAIDAAAVGRTVDESYRAAEIDPDDVDSGAVILTGEALRQTNARALADALADSAGDFVHVSAGHHLEATLAAHGAGAVDLARASGSRVLHVDIGGGTTKFAAIDPDGRLRTAAMSGGGRLVTWSPDHTIEHLLEGATTIASSVGVNLQVGDRLGRAEESAFIEAMCDAIYSLISGQPVGPLERALLLTEQLPESWSPEVVTFSGGVSEYIYGRESQTYRDIGSEIGRGIAYRCATQLAVPVVPLADGIRATVIGASQHTVQVSGNTVAAIGDPLLPLRNVPVLVPDLVPGATREEITAALVSEAARHERRPGAPVAFFVVWQGIPSYAPLSILASGIARALEDLHVTTALLLFDRDIAATVGDLLVAESRVGVPCLCIDGIEFSPFDFVDIGALLYPSGVYPVSIKSLLFSSRTH